MSSIHAHYRTPDQTFVGTPPSLNLLKQAMAQDRGKTFAALARDVPGF